jgi:hypothetical protein
MRFYQAPSSREISITRRQRPNAVEVVSQYNDGIDREGMTGFNGMECVPQMRNHIRITEYPLSLIGDNCEKVGAAWCGCSTVVHWIAQSVDEISMGNVMEILTLIMLGFTLFNPTYKSGDRTEST